MSTRRWRAALAAAVSLVVALGVVVVPLGAPAAQAADLSRFDPGNIISDAVFHDTGTMTAAQVQSFLVQRGASCTTGGGRTCLKDYRQPTQTRAADAYCRGTYTGASDETAAQIIAKVAVACGINPQVLIVTLQKEQGLITQPKAQSQYDKALGFACPDTAPCDAAYAGFFAQVYSAARQFQRYAAHPTSWTHQAGRTIMVRYHPNAACGSSPVFIANQATASLYNYTPYQPNAAALAAGYGTGDSCSSYGNRNFWSYFTDWFGSTNQRQPLGALDTVTAAGGGSVTVSGWAFDPDVSTSIQVHVYVDGKAVRSVTANGSRPDVASAYRLSSSAHGYRTTVGAAPGRRTVCVYAIDGNGGPVNPQIGCRDVVVTNDPPIGSLDSVSAAGGRVTARGWALDPDTTASITVRLVVDGTAVASATASASRPDVGRVHGKGDAHGFTLSAAVAAGSRRVCLQAVDASSGQAREIACRAVSVVNKAPIGALDGVDVKAGVLGVRGWALDPDTTASIRVHVYVDGKAVSSVAATGSRPDVDRAHGKGAAHGFSTNVPVAAGSREVCVYAIDSGGGTNPRIGCRTVQARNAAPVGELAVTATREDLAVSGWALDPDSDTALRTRLKLDGKVVAELRADAPAPGSGAAHGFGDAHGLAWSAGARPPGTYELCLEAADASTGTWSTVRCTTATVNGLPFGAVDSVTSPAAGKVRVQGWAIDPNSTRSIRVHVYVDGRATESVAADRDRPDVHAVHGMGAAHGFDTTVSATAGTREICVYAIDLEKETNPLLGCRTVTVR